MSPSLIRQWRLFEVTSEQRANHYLISGIQNKTHYNDIRNTLSKQYSIQSWQPDIQIINANLDTTRTLQLKYTSLNDAQLTNTRYDVMEHVETLWGYPVTMEDNIQPKGTDVDLFSNSNVGC